MEEYRNIFKPLMLKIRRNRFFFVILSLVAAILFALIIQRSSFITGGDVYYPVDPLTPLKNFSGAWVANQYMGSGNISIGANILMAIWSFLSRFLSPLACQFVWFTLLYFLTVYSFFLAASALSKESRLTVNPWVIFGASIFYLANPVTYISITQSSYLVAYSLAPFLIFAIIRLFLNDDIRYLFIVPIVSIFYSYASVNPPIYAASLTIPFVLWLIILIGRVKDRKKILFRTVSLVGLFLLANLFWIIPMILAGNDLKAEIGSGWVYWTSIKSTYWNILQLLGNWSFSDYSYGSAYQTYHQWYQILIYPIAIISFWAFTVFVLVKQLYANKIATRNKLVFAIGIFLLLQFYFFLASGNGGPFRIFFLLLYNYLPYFWLFREPWVKFTPEVVFLIAIIFLMIHSFLSDNKQMRNIYVGIGVFVVIYNLATAIFSPIISYDRGNFPSFRVNQPSYYQELANSSVFQAETRTLLYPGNPFYQVHLFWPSDGYYGVDPLPSILASDLISDDPGGGYSANSDSLDMIKSMYASINNKNWTAAKNFLKIFSVNNILVRNDLDYTQVGTKSTSSPDQKKAIIANLDLKKSTSWGSISNDSLSTDQYYQNEFKKKEDLNGEDALALYVLPNPVNRFYTPTSMDLVVGGGDIMMPVLSNEDFSTKAVLNLDPSSAQYDQNIAINNYFIAPQNDTNEADVSAEYRNYVKIFATKKSYMGTRQMTEDEFKTVKSATSMQVDYTLVAPAEGKYSLNYYIPEDLSPTEIESRLSTYRSYSFLLNGREFQSNPQYSNRTVKIAELELNKQTSYKLEVRKSTDSQVSDSKLVREASQDAKIEINSNSVAIKLPPGESGCYSIPLENIKNDKRYAVSFGAEVYSQMPVSISIAQDTDKNLSEILTSQGQAFNSKTMNDSLAPLFTMFSSKEKMGKINYSGVFQPDPLSTKYNLRICADPNVWQFKTKDVYNTSTQIKLIKWNIKKLPTETLYASSNSTQKNEIPDSPKITWQRMSSSKYQLAIKGDGKSFPLIFSESFNKNWSIYSGEDKGLTGDLRIIFSKSLYKESHFKANGYANGWVVQPNGEQELNLIVVNKANSYYGIAKVVSLIATILLLVFLAKIMKGRHEKKK